MILIVGLGNPGDKYVGTRHNLGFMVLDKLAISFSYSGKFNAEICQLTPEILLAMPQTFMNASGVAVDKIARFYKVSPENIWIIHDDIDLPLGRIKIRLGGAAAGHHGVESVIKELGTDQFIRFRLGIGRPDHGAEEQVEKYVLEVFSAPQKSEIKQAVDKTVEAVQSALAKGLERTMNEYN